MAGYFYNLFDITWCCDKLILEQDINEIRQHRSLFLPTAPWLLPTFKLL